MYMVVLTLSTVALASKQCLFLSRTQVQNKQKTPQTNTFYSAFWMKHLEQLPRVLPKAVFSLCLSHNHLQLFRAFWPAELTQALVVIFREIIVALHMSKLTYLSVQTSNQRSEDKDLTKLAMLKLCHTWTNIRLCVVRSRKVPLGSLLSLVYISYIYIYIYLIWENECQCVSQKVSSMVGSTPRSATTGDNTCDLGALRKAKLLRGELSDASPTCQSLIYTGHEI